MITSVLTGMEFLFNYCTENLYPSKLFYRILRILLNKKHPYFQLQKLLCYIILPYLEHLSFTMRKKLLNLFRDPSPKLILDLFSKLLLLCVPFWIKSNLYHLLWDPMLSVNSNVRDATFDMWVVQHAVYNTVSRMHGEVLPYRFATQFTIVIFHQRTLLIHWTSTYIKSFTYSVLCLTQI